MELVPRRAAGRASRRLLGVLTACCSPAFNWFTQIIAGGLARARRLCSGRRWPRSSGVLRARASAEAGATSSPSDLTAERYDLVVDDQFADEPIGWGGLGGPIIV